MKLSYAISLQDSKFNYIAKANWLKKAKFLSQLGFEAIELSIRNPEQTDILLIERALYKYNLELSAIGTGQMFFDDGLSLSSLNKDIRKKAIGRIKAHIDLGHVFEAQVIIGLARGRKANSMDSDKIYLKNLFVCLKELADYAKKKEVTIAIEPINRYEVSFLHTLKEAAEFIRKIKSPSLRILLDTFHMNIEEQSLVQPIFDLKNKISYVHLSDNNRLCPGMGHFDFKSLIAALQKIGYQGFLSAEILPTPSFEVCARTFSKNIRRML